MVNSKVPIFAAEAQDALNSSPNAQISLLGVCCAGHSPFSVVPDTPLKTLLNANSGAFSAFPDKPDMPDYEEDEEEDEPKPKRKKKRAKETKKA